MDTHDEEVQNTAYNPFPEPQTIPSGWDLSGIIPILQDPSRIDQENSQEG
jgi:hypothetical protein